MRGHMRDARFQIPGAALLDKVVQKLDKLDMGDRDTKGDVYEYMLAKIATAGQNGQFRTPRHIIAMMVELVQPKRKRAAGSMTRDVRSRRIRGDQQFACPHGPT
jgi:type I restriction enzyme M protein